MVIIILRPVGAVRASGHANRWAKLRLLRELRRVKEMQPADAGLCLCSFCVLCFSGCSLARWLAGGAGGAGAGACDDVGSLEDCWLLSVLWRK